MRLILGDKNMKARFELIVVVSILSCVIIFFSSQCCLSISTENSRPSDLKINSGISRAISKVGSSWIQDTALEFNKGTLENMVISTEGNLELKLQSKAIIDDFMNETRISVKENVVADTENAKIKLKNSWRTYWGDSFDWGNEVIQTSDNGFAIVGTTTSYGAGNQDLWLIKTDPSGEEQWNKTFGGSVHDEGHGIIQTSDGGYVIVGFIDFIDIYLVKTDSFGVEQWSKTFDSGEVDQAYSIIPTSDGGFVIGGWSENMSAFDADVWLIKTDGAGNEQWNKTFGGSSYDKCYEVIQASDGGYVLVGYTNSYASLIDDVWIIKTDSAGNEQWNNTFGHSWYHEYGESIVQTSDNGYAIIGYSEVPGSTMNTYSAWLIKTDSSGNEQWNKTFGTNNNLDRGYGILQNSDNGYLLIGLTESYGSGMSDGWLIKTDNLGVEVWSRTFGGTNEDSAKDLIKSNDNKNIIVGHSASYGAGEQDVWFLKTDELGYFINGTLRSTNLLANDIASTIDTFKCSAEIPMDTFVNVRFSNDNENWYNAEGIINEFTVLSNGNNNLDLTSLSWSGSEFYYELRFSTENMYLPAINDIELKYSQYSPTGTYISNLLNTGDQTNWRELTWTSTTPENTEIKIQLRTAADESELLQTDFVGPDGKSTSYYTSPGPIWSGHYPNNWIQFKVYFATNDLTKSSILDNITISYNRKPRLDFPKVAPSKGDITTIFNFTIEYFDKDNDTPEFIKINIDNENFTMSEVDSEDLNHSDGKSYWYTTDFDAGEHIYGFYSSDSDLDCCINKTEITVDFGPLDHITIEPSSKTITTDDYQLFTALGFDADNNPLSITPSWEVTGGGTVDQNGNFTAVTPGTWTVFANASRISGNSIITVTPGELDHIIVTPGLEKITTDDYLVFSAAGFDADNNVLVISPTWEITGGGTIDQYGNFTATTPGEWTVYANFTGVSGISTLIVEVGILDHIVISPAQIEINVSESMSFIAKGYDADNNKIKLSPKWEVGGGGNIDRNGRFTATKSGTWTVYANQSGVSGTATVNVISIDDEKDADGDKEEKKDNTMLFAGIGIIVIIVIILILLFLFIKKIRIKGEDEKKEEAVEEPALSQQSLPPLTPQLEPPVFPQYTEQTPQPQQQQDWQYQTQLQSLPQPMEIQQEQTEQPQQYIESPLESIEQSQVSETSEIIESQGQLQEKTILSEPPSQEYVKPVTQVTTPQENIQEELEQQNIIQSNTTESQFENQETKTDTSPETQ